jgi:hypothetical protein
MEYASIEKKGIMLLCILSILFFITFSCIDIIYDLGLFKSFITLSTKNFYIITASISNIVFVFLVFIFLFSIRKIIQNMRQKCNKSLFHIYSIPVIICYLIIYNPFFIPFTSIVPWIVMDFLGTVLTCTYLMFAFE